MFNNPIYESAFKQLDLLYELDFNLSTDSVEDIKDFMDEEEVDNEVDVIDLDAEDESELDDSNIGKIILQCPCCETVVCKNADEIELPDDCEDDEDCMVQVGEQCPICFSEEGYKIIGKVAPYEEVEVEIEPKDDDEDEDEIDDEEDIDDSEDEDFGDEMETDFDDAESDADNEEADEEKDEKDSKKKNESLTEDLDQPNFDIPGLTTQILATPEENIENAGGEEELGSFYTVIYKYNNKPVCELLISDYDYDDYVAWMPLDFTDPICDERSYYWASRGVPGDSRWAKPFNYVAKIIANAISGWAVPNKNGITEGLNDINLETDHDRISIHAEQKAENGEEMIAPLDFQAANEIVDNQPTEEGEDDYLNDIDTGDEEAFGDEGVLGDEIPTDDMSADISLEDTETLPEEDVDVGDVDEEALDGLGESYFRSVYDNVKSYITESIHEKNDKLIVEGIITFDSGNKKRTLFVLEGNTLSSNGKCSMLAENLQITPGKKAFTINGTLNNGKFIAESLDYNYKVGSTRVKGNINK